MIRYTDTTLHTHTKNFIIRQLRETERCLDLLERAAWERQNEDKDIREKTLDSLAKRLRYEINDKTCKCAYDALVIVNRVIGDMKNE